MVDVAAAVVAFVWQAPRTTCSLSEVEELSGVYGVGYKIKNDMESTANSGQWGAGEIGKQKMHSTMLTKGREPGKQVSVSVERQKKKKVNFMTCTHRVRGGEMEW